ncbi:DUF2058 domain-containing protein [Aliidiomarina sp. Khilg15.8]
MAKSLADQLLGAGLVDEKKAKKVQQEKRKQKQQQPKLKKGQALVDEDKERIRQERAEQAARDLELNRQRKAEEDTKALKAQALQMLQQHEQPAEGEIRFNFADPRTNKVKAIYVSAAMQQHLANGKLAICALNESYVVVPKTIADKVAERFADAIIFEASAEQQEAAKDEDDPYKDYPIPDDLMW